MFADDERWWLKWDAEIEAIDTDVFLILKNDLANGEEQLHKRNDTSTHLAFSWHALLLSEHL